MYLNLLYGWHLWDIEWNIKNSYSKGIKIKKSKKEYQDLLDSFPEGILITQAKMDNEVMFIN